MATVVTVVGDYGEFLLLIFFFCSVSFTFFSLEKNKTVFMLVEEKAFWFLKPHQSGF